MQFENHFAAELKSAPMHSKTSVNQHSVVFTGREGGMEGGMEGVPKLVRTRR